MIFRRLIPRLNELLRHSPAVVRLGPRQAGKTTLALEIGAQTASIYLDLEDENDRAKLANPSRYLADHENELVIHDQVHRVPELFQRLRGIIDRGRRHGKANGRFLLLGAAATGPFRQSGESFAWLVSGSLQLNRRPVLSWLRLRVLLVVRPSKIELS
jgi:predicted AAA+ superfamily ATPase